MLKHHPCLNPIRIGESILNRHQIVFICVVRLILSQTESRLVPNQSGCGKYNVIPVKTSRCYPIDLEPNEICLVLNQTGNSKYTLIPVSFTRIRSIFLCVLFRYFEYLSKK